MQRSRRSIGAYAAILERKIRRVRDTNGKLVLDIRFAEILLDILRRWS